MQDFENQVLDEIRQDSELSREEIAEQAIRDAEELLNELNGRREQSTSEVEALFKAIDFAPTDPFSPPESIPSFDAATYNEMKGMVAGQARALEIGLSIAKNHVQAEKIEGAYTDAALVQAQTRVKQQSIVNEGYRLQEAVEAGNLIMARTEGLQLQTANQQQKNLTASKLNEIEAQRGQALIQGALIEVEGIRTNNNSRLLEAQRDFDSMRGAGTNGSYNSF